MGNKHNRESLASEGYKPAEEVADGGKKPEEQSANGEKYFILYLFILVSGGHNLLLGDCSQKPGTVKDYHVGKTLSNNY